MKTATPSSPSRVSSIFYWKIFGALVMPKGNLLKQYLPNGAVNAVSLQLSGCRGICPNPLAASRKENTVSLAVTSSEVGRMQCSPLTDLFTFVRSTQIQAVPVFFFRTGIMGVHHSVGCVTRSMAPSFSILLISSLTFCNVEKGTRRALCTACSTASSLNRILTGSVFRVACSLWVRWLVTHLARFSLTDNAWLRRLLTLCPCTT